MNPQNVVKEVESREFQIQHYKKMLDMALKNDLEFAEAKKILHTNRELRDRLEQLTQNPETPNKMVAD